MPLLRWVGSVVATLFATSGIRLDKLYFHRLVPIGICLILYLVMMRHATVDVALAFWLLQFLLRYTLLFGSFVRNGFAERLIVDHGEEHGYEIYETITAVLFFNSAAAFGTLVHATEWTLLPGFEWRGLFVAGGMALSAVGFVVNLWGTLVIGVDVYYYKDLFLGRFLGDFKQEGPYRIFKNPMYGVGQCAAYGAALMSGSLAGVLATMLNQGMMYLFYFSIEKPHIMKMISRSRARAYPELGATSSP